MEARSFGGVIALTSIKHYNLKSTTIHKFSNVLLCAVFVGRQTVYTLHILVLQNLGWAIGGASCRGYVASWEGSMRARQAPRLCERVSVQKPVSIPQSPPCRAAVENCHKMNATKCQDNYVWLITTESSIFWISRRWVYFLLRIMMIAYTLTSPSLRNVTELWAFDINSIIN